MRLFHSVSIATKLRWIVSSAISLALFLASVAFLGYDYYTFRTDKTKDVQALAQVIGSNSTGALNVSGYRLGERSPEGTWLRAPCQGSLYLQS
jgi:hypothetical protein